MSIVSFTLLSFLGALGIYFAFAIIRALWNAYAMTPEMEQQAIDEFKRTHPNVHATYIEELAKLKSAEASRKKGAL